MWFRTITDFQKTMGRRPSTKTPGATSPQTRQSPQRAHVGAQQPDSGDSGSSGSDASPVPTKRKLRLTRRGYTEDEELAIRNQWQDNGRTLENQSHELALLEKRLRPDPSKLPTSLIVEQRSPQKVRRIVEAYEKPRRKKPIQKEWPKRPEPSFIFKGPYCSPRVTHQWDRNLNNYYCVPHGKTGERKRPSPAPKTQKPSPAPQRRGRTPEALPAKGAQLRLRRPVIPKRLEPTANQEAPAEEEHRAPLPPPPKT